MTPDSARPLRPSEPLRIAALVKQIPAFETMELDSDGRLRRDGVELEMNPYCRRAVSKACELAETTGGEVVVVTLGPPSAEDTLREAIAWGQALGTTIRGVLVTDPAFAGSDTLATARAISRALESEGRFDLILAGRNSVDADTGQVGPEVAELMGLPFLTGVKSVELDGRGLDAHCEHDDGIVRARVQLPAVCSVAERLCDPCKVDPAGRAAVDAVHISTVSADDLGPGPWGAAASPTRVGDVRLLEVAREGRRLEGPVHDQVEDAVAALEARGAFDTTTRPPTTVVPATGGDGPVTAVLGEPDRHRETAELLGAAARLAADTGGSTALLDVTPEGLLDVSTAGAEPAAGRPMFGNQGADRVVELVGSTAEDDVADVAAHWTATTAPWALLAPSTAWGREVASRIAARVGGGLTGDAVELDVIDGRLRAWKPAFGGQLVAAITATSEIQLVTVRAGVLPLPAARTVTPEVERIAIPHRGRVDVLARTRDDDIETLALAEVVIGVGQAVEPDEYPLLDPLLDALGAELGATRKVTDRGWLPRARQIGITGRAIAPRLYIGIGLSGKFNHSVGIRAAGTVVGVNPDPDAPIHEHCDLSLTADWREAVPLLAATVDSRSSAT
ncbi:MAG: FAD-binding protein [Acidimicrobiia bacterium]|nr:FAD-binding protein [Acidimicrobiia bacterium]